MKTQCYIKNIQIEVGENSTLFEHHKGLEQFMADSSGHIKDKFTGIYPTTSFYTNNPGVIMNVGYLADTKHYIDNSYVKYIDAGRIIDYI
jgi:hypothetical protein